MDIGVYRKALEELVLEAISNSDGSNASIAEYLGARRVSGLFVRNKTEKQRALDDARKAFDEHRHWPLEIVISHLGLERGLLTKGKP